MNRLTSVRLAPSFLLIGVVLYSAVTAAQTPTAQAPAAPPPQALTYEMAQQVIDAPKPRRARTSGTSPSSSPTPPACQWCCGG